MVVVLLGIWTHIIGTTDNIIHHRADAEIDVA
jgi:hypothetical protein